jgi:tetratricopeptide (TPR) repeat protein
MDEYKLIKKLLKHIYDGPNVIYNPQYSKKKVNDILAKLKITQIQLKGIADSVGSRIVVTLENAEDLERFAGFLITAFYDFKLAIKLYFEIIKILPIQSSVYKKLLDIYFYDFNAFVNFDFVGNISKKKIKANSLDSIYLCITCFYLGQLLQRLGKFSDAYLVYEKALNYKMLLNNICKYSEYGIKELNYLASIYKNSSIIKQQNDARPLLIIGVVFFGDEYLDLFTNVAGPSFFCQNNLDELIETWEPVLISFSSETDNEHFKSTGLFKYLSNRIKIETITIPDELFDSHPDSPRSGQQYNPSMVYALSGLIQTCLFIIAKNSSADLINLIPDVLYSNNIILTINQILSDKYEIIFTPGIRLNRAAIQQYIHKKHTNLLVSGIEHQELSNVACSNLHSATKACFFSNERVTYPGILIWGDSCSMRLHSFQMHPIFISHKQIVNSNVRRFDSIDGDFVNGIIPNSEKWDKYIYVTTRDSQICMYELSSDLMSVDKIFKTANLLDEAGGWISTFMRPLNFWLFKHAVQIGAASNAAEIDETTFVAQVTELENSLSFVKSTEINLPYQAKLQNLDALLNNLDTKQISQKFQQKLVLEATVQKLTIFQLIKCYILKIVQRIFRAIPLRYKRRLLMTLKKLAQKYGGLYEKAFYVHQKDRALYNEI